ncbi:MAG: cyanophycinase [bacterium]|nr:cyanophycinase [bacterium]
MTKRNPGRLMIVGGHEDKEGDQIILKEIAAAVKEGTHLSLVTVATEEPEAMAKDYTAIFNALGVKHVDAVDVRTREDGHNPDIVERVKQASVIFFTGGDQLRITSQIGDTPLFTCMQTRYQEGATIAGTSAGAAVMPATMLISGSGDESSHISALGMAPGLDFINGVVIDSHFAERGRMGRLLGAVAQNPANLGLGIDEDTAIIVERGKHFRVLGSGAVYVVDGTSMTYSSLSEQQPEGILTIHDVKIHVLGEGQIFDLVERRPVLQEATHANART